MFRTHVVAVAVVVGFALTGCVSSGSVRPAEVAVPEADAECLLGSWTLDLDDYAAQAEPTLIEIGIPIAGLTYTGTYRIEFIDTGSALRFGLASQLTSSATVNGVPVSGSESTLVDADFAWADESHDAVLIENWAVIEPRDVDGPLPPLDILDPEAGGEIRIACSGDTLSLSGPGALFVGLFIRQ